MFDTNAAVVYLQLGYDAPGRVGVRPDRMKTWDSGAFHRFLKQVNSPRRRAMPAIEKHSKKPPIRGRSFPERGADVRSAGARRPHWRRRIVVCGGLVVASLLIFYSSLIFTADPLPDAEAEQIERSIQVLENSGFTTEVFYLRRLAVFRGGDNWLNSTIAKENAYAATNYPFAVVTIYPDFFTYTADDTERASILLHEARHIAGDDEPAAYSFVWKNKKALGWTADRYRGSVVWKNIRKQTREYAPSLFVCEFNDYNDCTE